MITISLLRNSQQLECFVMRCLNINAMDELDPVHYRADQNPEREFDHDGDLGHEHEDTMHRRGGGSGFVAGSFRPIADALPVIEAPSIVAELPATETQLANIKGKT